MDTMDATENPAASTELPEEAAKAQQEDDDLSIPPYSTVAKYKNT